MDQLLKTFKNVVFCEVTAYKELLALSKQKKTILVNNKTAELKDITEMEQGFLCKIKQYEADREDCVSKIAASSGLAQQTLDFQMIIDLAQDPLRQELIQLKSELEKMISELSDVNELNKTLINTHMKYISFCIEAIASHIRGSNTYSHSGRFKDEKSVSNVLIDRTV